VIARWAETVALVHKFVALCQGTRNSHGPMPIETLMANTVGATQAARCLRNSRYRGRSGRN
jgi:hypothetical protein